ADDGIRDFHVTRVLTCALPICWMSVVFHNLQNRIWNAIQEAIQRAGFVIADVSTLDKQQGTFNQTKIGYTTAVKQDLIITSYKTDRKSVVKVNREENNIHKIDK